MTDNQSVEKKKSIIAAKMTFGDRLSGWIDNPIKSAFAATAATLTAIGFVLSGIWIVSVSIS